jgi:hypothetical protein
VIGFETTESEQRMAKKTSSRKSKKTVKAAKQNGRSPWKEWTKEHDKELKGYSRTRTPVPQVAKQMRRTQSAVRQRAWGLGISLGHRKRRGEKVVGGRRVGV